MGSISLIFQSWNHEWYQTSSGRWHQTLSRNAFAFKLQEDGNDIELVCAVSCFQFEKKFEKFRIRYLEFKQVKL